mmetsp:Transcript_90593/g.255790  ORF Transcript_90593/g.255790 Transcript_90593/m.255790 type:complete len:200 (-) Transcript_90593:1981-2580(-)
MHLGSTRRLLDARVLPHESARRPHPQSVREECAERSNREPVLYVVGCDDELHGGRRLAAHRRLRPASECPRGNLGHRRDELSAADRVVHDGQVERSAPGPGHDHKQAPGESLAEVFPLQRGVAAGHVHVGPHHGDHARRAGAGGAGVLERPRAGEEGRAPCRPCHVPGDLEQSPRVQVAHVLAFLRLSAPDGVLLGAAA